MTDRARLGLLGKIAVSVAVGGICIWLVLGQMDLAATKVQLLRLPMSACALYVVTLAMTHAFRAWRWKYLLRPIGVELSPGKLLSISSVGFMAILALPVRLGEFVRPYFVVRGGQSRMSAVLGTVAVERIIDGLILSGLLFGTTLLWPPRTFAPGLRFATWLSLIGFLVLTLFLCCALLWTESTIRLALRLTFLRLLAPRQSDRLADKLRALIHGFRALREPKNLLPFLAHSILYWGINGFGMWLLAHSMNLDVTLPATLATMALTGVLISLPNAPALVGQFQLGIMEGLRAYLPATVVAAAGGAYAIVVHGVQLIWYVAVGLVCLRHATGGRGSLGDVMRASNEAALQADDAGAA